MAKISLLSVLAITVLSCNSLKKVDDDEYLVARNTIYVDSAKVKNEALKSLVYQKTNTAILGYPFRLNLYNLAKDNPDSLYQDWLHRKPKREERLDRWLSKKQVRRLGESFLVKGLSVWLKDIGEAPVILDTAKTRKTLERLKAYYDTKGYFNSTTSYAIDTTSKKQKAIIDYDINLGKPFYVDSVSNNISSKAIDSLYFLNARESFVKTGQQFDLENFNAERERLTEVFRNHGIRNFQESSISYDIVRDTVVEDDDQMMNVIMNIGGLKQRGVDSVTTSPYVVERIKNIDVYTDYLSATNSRKSKMVTYGDYNFHYTGKFFIKPKTLANAIYFKKDSVYRDLDKIRTSRQLNSLNIFKYPNIIFTPDSTKNLVNTSIYLAPKQKYSLATSFELSRSNIRRLGIGLSASLLIRNIFKGAENLSITGNGTFGLLSSSSFQENFFSEFGADINLNFPRLWFPFINTSKLVPNYSLPTTRIAVGSSFQKNIGLDKQTLNAVFGYNWTPNDLKKHTLELLNVQFVRNVNADRFFDIYQNTYNRLDNIADKYENEPLASSFFEIPKDSNEPKLIIPEGTQGFIDSIQNGSLPVKSTQDFIDVSRIEERRVRLTENNLIFASNYTFNLNTRNGATDNNFYQFRLRLESAGNLLALLSNVVNYNKNDQDQLLIFNVPFSQYIKTEFDFIKYWELSRTNVLATRAIFGIAIPYGNSNNIPFVRSYFAGGSNDNRAWYPYSLGPGSTNAVNDFNEANLKISLNMEYRFPIVGDIHGAVFADAGNIWNVFDNVEDPAATFEGLSSLRDIALGSGFGLRYDFTYFLLRLDLGFKTYNPARIASKRWFTDYNLRNSVLQIGINYPF